jgi:hypothetical protein
MGERATHRDSLTDGVMKRAAMVAMTVLATAGLSAWLPLPGAAETVEVLPAQARDRPVSPRIRVHPPARIRVYPLQQSDPGPGAVRQCAFWLATEHRPSGTVIVPQQHCWWERG